MSKRRDAVVIAAVLLVAAALLAVSRLAPQTQLEDRAAQETLAPDAVEYVDAAPEDAGEEAQSAMIGPMPPAQTQQVRGHVVLTVAGRQYGEPIAMDRDKIITLKQDDGKINKVHITPEKVYMESSTCSNQDCVGQGEITLENYQTRVLSTFVICLPNSVTIEMVPATD